jgi:hypothetical protein
MTWQVRWRRSAKNDLAALWLDANTRSSVTAAANQIDNQLARNPLNVGESRENDRRILIESPLAVTYKVNPSEMKVLETRVWRIS